MSDDLPFCSIPYVDPVQRLASLIGEAAEKGGWLPGEPSDKLRMEVRESIQRAIVGTERIGHSLRYGMGKQAGEFETELRRVLQELKSASYSMPPCTPYYRDYFSRFREDVEITAQMSAKLLTTASEPYDPRQWSSRLGALRGALDAVHRGMAQFFKAAELASDSLEQTRYYVEMVLIPSLEERLAEVMPSIAFALEDAYCSDLEVEALCRRLQKRADIIYSWGVELRDEASSCDKPNKQFDDCCQRVHSFIGVLTPPPPDNRAETPEAVTGDVGTAPGKAVEAAGEKRAGNYGAAIPSIQSSIPVLAFTTEGVLDKLIEEDLLGERPKRTDATRWCNNQGLTGYDRESWKQATGQPPPPSKGKPIYYNGADFLEAISKEKARRDAAEETVAECEAAKDGRIRTKEPHQPY